MGRCWVTEGKDMVPKVSSLVETFMATTGMCMPPHVVQQCWPMLHNETPVQDLKGIKEHIVKRLDEVVTQTPSGRRRCFAITLGRSLMSVHACWGSKSCCKMMMDIIPVQLTR